MSDHPADCMMLLLSARSKVKDQLAAVDAAIEEAARFKDMSFDVTPEYITAIQRHKNPNTSTKPTP